MTTKNIRRYILPFAFFLGALACLGMPDRSHMNISQSTACRAAVRIASRAHIGLLNPHRASTCPKYLYALAKAKADNLVLAADDLAADPDFRIDAIVAAVSVAAGTAAAVAAKAYAKAKAADEQGEL